MTMNYAWPRYQGQELNYKCPRWMSIEQSTRDQFAIAKLLIITARARARVCVCLFITRALKIKTLHKGSRFEQTLPSFSAYKATMCCKRIWVRLELTVLLLQTLDFAVVFGFLVARQASSSQCDRRKLLITLNVRFTVQHLTVTVADGNTFTTCRYQPSYSINVRTRSVARFLTDSWLSCSTMA